MSSFGSRQEAKTSSLPNKTSHKDKTDDTAFDFIKFLNEIRERYNLSPTPLVIENTPPPANPSLTSEMLTTTEVREINAAQFVVGSRLDVMTDATDANVAVDPKIDHEKKGVTDQKTSRMQALSHYLNQKPSVGEVSSGSLEYRKLF